jgi:heat shock protein HslJ
MSVNRGTREILPRDAGLPRMLRSAFLVAATLLVMAGAATVVAGCSSGSRAGENGDVTTPHQVSLEGSAWRLTGWSVGSQDPNDFTITAEFKDGRVGGTSAVNQYGGPYRTGDDGAFSVGELASTMMAGPEPDMRAEQTYLKLLAEAKRFAVDGTTLTLLDANGNESLIYTATTLASPSP